MFLTTKARYAIMAMLEMCEGYKSNTTVSISTLAESQGLSVYYLEQIFARLKREGLVNSIKGPGGGYIFTLPPEKIFLNSILIAVGENTKITKCTKEEGVFACTKKNDDIKCNSHKLWKDLGNYLVKYFIETSLADVQNNNYFFKRIQDKIN
jgi:Rrf2 family protein